MTRDHLAQSILAGIILSALGLCHLCAAEEIFRDSDTVRVTYQYRIANGKSWINSNAVLRNVTTESMIQNQAASRHGNAEVRILSAQDGRTQRAQVRYQYKTKGTKSWTNGSASLIDARTEKMAVNQLKAKHPDCTIRILSMKRQ